MESYTIWRSQGISLNYERRSALETGEILPTQNKISNRLETGEIIPTQKYFEENDNFDEKFNEEDLEIPQEPESKIELHFPSEC